MKRDIPPWHEDMQDSMKTIACFYCLNAKDWMPFLTATWCGQMALCDYDKEFVKRTLDHMFDKYLEIKKKKK